MTKLTKRIVDGLQPRHGDYFIWDEKLSGFGLRVMPSGRKSYLVQYRVGSRTRRLTFARCGTMTPEEARKKARELLVAVANGENPAEERRINRHAPTMAALCDRFLADHVAHRCKARTHDAYRCLIEHHIKPGLGSYLIADVTRADIARLHQAMARTPYQANRTLSVLSKMFNLAEDWGLRLDGSNPCRRLRKYREIARERYLTTEEFARLGAVLREVEEDGSEAPHAVTAIRLLLLTGCRLGEIQTLEWSHVRGNALMLPDSKTGAKTVYLGKAARDVLTRIERRPGNTYVIVGKVEGQHLTDLERPWRHIRARAGLDDVRIHDLRHSFASTAVGAGEGLPMIGKLLGHTQVQTTARYAHLADAPALAAADKVSANIANWLGAAEKGPDETPGDPPIRRLRLVK